MALNPAFLLLFVLLISPMVSSLVCYSCDDEEKGCEGNKKVARDDNPDMICIAFAHKGMLRKQDIIHRSECKKKKEKLTDQMKALLDIEIECCDRHLCNKDKPKQEDQEVLLARVKKQNERRKMMGRGGGLGDLFGGPFGGGGYDDYPHYPHGEL